ncbi:Aste57867_9855 [Aphanomyces stellatus]|uniref:Aste57867_9855 protein n=1 Tax=Aphanomyces stellatus TaxID=120398 RepID=A0A485KNW8_9STRA|nr:hypothetical protein As57867_009816 [Aphanomyces stellatus]VFT86734.1 Aste57867_9855 [Aphanomyces stellatus]
MPPKAAPAHEAVEEQHVEVIPEVQGTGTFHFPDGSVYEGDYQSFNQVVMRHGVGTFVHGPETYSGTWVKDQMEGKGTYQFASGASFDGEFRSNVFSGNGEYRWSDGASYVGGWTNSKMHGQGCYKDKDGVEWRGTFFNGKYDNGRAFLTLR